MKKENKSSRRGSGTVRKKRARKLLEIKRYLTAVLKNPVTYLIIAFPFMMALLVQVIYSYEKGISMETIGDSFWNFLVVFIAGYYDICVVTPLGRFFSFIILVCGILVFSMLTGKLASVFTDMQMKKDKGLRKLKNMEKHFLLCGWRPGFEKILDSVLASNPDLSPSQIVLVNNAPSENIEPLFTQNKFKGLRYVSGDFSDAEILKKALVSNAERALIISDRSKESASQLEVDSMTVLAVLTMKNLNPLLYIAAEIYDSKFESHLNLAHCDEVILTTSYEYSLLATASSGQGYSSVIKELIGEDADSGIIIGDIPSEFLGKTYKEYVKSLKPTSETGEVLIGLLLNTGNFYQRRKDAVREAQKNPDVKKIVDNLVKVKTLKSNEPYFAPPSDFVIQPNTKSIFVRGKEI